MPGTKDVGSKEKEKIFSGKSGTERYQEDVQDKRGQHPNSLANLQPYPKGVSGNPSGRPLKYENLKRILNEFGDKETKNWRGESEGSRREQVWKRIWQEAILGNMKYVQLLAKLGCLDDKQ